MRRTFSFPGADTGMSCIRVHWPESRGGLYFINSGCASQHGLKLHIHHRAQQPCLLQACNESWENGAGLRQAYFGVPCRMTELAQGVETVSASSAPPAAGRGAVRQLSAGLATDARSDSARASEDALAGGARGDGPAAASSSGSGSSSCAYTEQRATVGAPNTRDRQHPCCWDTFEV